MELGSNSDSNSDLFLSSGIGHTNNTSGIGHTNTTSDNGHTNTTSGIGLTNTTSGRVYQGGSISKFKPITIFFYFAHYAFRPFRTRRVYCGVVRLLTIEVATNSESPSGVYFP